MAKGAKAATKPVVDALSALPRVPTGLSVYQKAQWKVAGADLVKRRLLVPVVLPLLENYVIALSLVRECQKALKKHGLLLKTTGGLVKVNPASTQMAKYQDICARLAAELGLSPAARSKKDFQKGGYANDGAPPGLDI